MPNMRLIYSNIVDTSTITASSTAGSLTVANLKNDYKGKVHRSTGTSVTYTITFPSATQVGGVCLPATNLSPTSTIRVRLYNSATLIADSTTIQACPGATLELWDWSVPLNANSFVFGGASKTAVWFNNQQSATSAVIDIVDTSNSAGYIDCARLVIGPYWEPTYNVSNNISITLADTSSNVRNDSGDLLSDRGTIYESLSIDFSVLLETDKSTLVKILRKVGTSKNILISVFPDNNSISEQMHLIYGKRSNSSVDMELYGIYTHAIDIEGW